MPSDWSPAEKKITRRVFDAALLREGRFSEGVPFIRWAALIYGDTLITQNQTKTNRGIDQ